MKEVFIYIVSSIVLAILCWLFERLKSLISVKIQNAKAQQLLFDVEKIVEDAVKSTYQTYVESLKQAGEFDKNAQVTALTLAKEKIMTSLSEEAIAFIDKNYLDLDSWIDTSIHAALYDLKK